MVEVVDMSDKCNTRRPFTAAVCMRCAAGPDLVIVEQLRAAVRRCQHGILVETRCLLGELTCATRYPSYGTMMLLQPCTVDRVPNASVAWVSPIKTEADAKEVCQWVASGRWDRAELPVRLRAELNLSRDGHHN